MYEKTKKFLKKLGITYIIERNKKLQILHIDQEYWEKIGEFCEKNNEIFTIERDIYTYKDPITKTLTHYPKKINFYIKKKNNF